MATWSIDGGASIDSNGVATFPKNETTSDKTYTITYEDDGGCTGSTTYTVPKCETTCQSAFTVSYSDEGNCKGSATVTCKDCDGKAVAPDVIGDGPGISITVNPPLTPDGDYIIFFENTKKKSGCGATSAAAGATISTPTIAGIGSESASISVAGCCKECTMSAGPVYSTLLNYVQIGVSITNPDGGAAVYPDSGTVSFDYQIKWNACAGNVDAPQDTFGSFSGSYDSTTNVEIPICGLDERASVSDVIFSNFTCNLSSNCITYSC